MKNSILFFDLDETLYPAGNGLWDAIAERIDLYIHETLGLPCEKIPSLRFELYNQYGTTMRGLSERYQINCKNYLDFVHDVPLQNYIQPNPELKSMLQQYPQRKIIFTNADLNHAQRVLRILNIEDCFEQIIDVLDIFPYCKPQLEAYQKVLGFLQLKDGNNCVMLDDKLKNLYPAHDLGFQTILIGNDTTAPQWTASITNIMQLPEVLNFLD